MDQNEAINSINSDLIRGHIDTIILKALQAGDRYGYDIIKEIEHKSEGQYVIKQPTLYSCLKRLEVQGFVKSYWGSKSIGGRKKYFTLTDMGRELFIKNINDWNYSRDVINKLISDDVYTTNDRAINQVCIEEDVSIENEEELFDHDNINEIESSEMPTAEAQFEVDDEELNLGGCEILASTNEESSVNDESIVEDEIIESENSNYLEEEISNNPIAQSISNNEEIDLNSLPLSPAEQNHYDFETVDLPEAENLDFLNQFYDEQNQESYIENTNSAEYEPIQNNLIDVNNYFADIEEYNYEDEEEIASSESVQQPIEEKNIENDIEINNFNNNDTTSRRLTRELPAENDTVFFSYNRPVADFDEISSVIDKGYRAVIAKLISDNVVVNEKPEIIENLETSKVEQEPEQSKIEIAQAPSTVSEITENGDKILVREHNHSAIKIYNSKHYYYSNQLKLFQSGIMFAIMLIELICCFYFIEIKTNGLVVTRLNLALYIVAVLMAATPPIISYFASTVDYYKRKRISYNAKSNVFFSIAVTILTMLIIFFINVYGGILVGKINNYLSSLIMPMVLATNIIVNTVVFHLLYKSGKFNLDN